MCCTGTSTHPGQALQPAHREQQRSRTSGPAMLQKVIVGWRGGGGVTHIRRSIPLRKYFSWCRLKVGIPVLSFDPDSEAPTNTHPGRPHSALLCLAAAHASFGHPQEALHALAECLRVAQSGGDPWNLLHALASLTRILQLSGGGQAAGGGSGDAAGLAGLDCRAAERQLQLQQLLRCVLACACACLCMFPPPLFE